MLLEEIKNIKTTKKVLRDFGLILAIVLAIFGGISLWKESESYKYLFPGSGASLILAMLLPNVLKFIYLPWMTVATIIGWVMTRVILKMLYYLILTPIGIAMKLFGKDILDEKINKDKPSYWVPRDKTILKEQFERQF